MTREGVNVVGDDFMLATAADIVADPSAPDAFVEGIMEGKGYGMVASFVKGMLKKPTSRSTPLLIRARWKRKS